MLTEKTSFYSYLIQVINKGAERGNYNYFSSYPHRSHSTDPKNQEPVSMKYAAVWGWNSWHFSRRRNDQINPNNSFSIVILF